MGSAVCRWVHGTGRFGWTALHGQVQSATDNAPVARWCFIRRGLSQRQNSTHRNIGSGDFRRRRRLYGWDRHGSARLVVCLHRRRTTGKPASRVNPESQSRRCSQYVCRRGLAWDRAGKLRRANRIFILKSEPCRQLHPKSRSARSLNGVYNSSDFEPGHEEPNRLQSCLPRRGQFYIAGSVVRQAMASQFIPMWPDGWKRKITWACNPE